jgi:hypothetical protein
MRPSSWKVELMAFGFIGEKFTSLLAKDRITVRRGASSGEIEYADLVFAVESGFAPLDSPTFIGSAEFPAADEAGEPIVYDQVGARLAGLTSTGEIELSATTPQLRLTETDSATNDGNFQFQGSGAGSLFLFARNDAGSIKYTFAEFDSKTGETTVADLTSTGEVAVASGFPILSLEDTNGLADEKRYRFYVNNSALYLAGQKDDGTGVPIFTFKSADDNNGNAPSVSTYSPVVLDFDQAAAVTVPAATAATHAAQVSAIDAATGRLAIGGKEIGDTGWRNVSSLLLNGWTQSGGVVLLRRQGRRVTLWIAGTSNQGIDASAATSNVFLRSPSGFSLGTSPTNARYYFMDVDGVLVKTYTANDDLGASGFGTAVKVQTMGEQTWHTADAWPSTLPGTAA